MSVFLVYLELGFEHLLDLQGYDHILFLAALCAAYTISRWRELLVLVTAFTAGHTVSLALATVGVVTVRASVVELLIPVTIVATAAINLAALRRRSRPPDRAAPTCGAGASGPVTRRPAWLRRLRERRDPESGWVGGAARSRKRQSSEGPSRRGDDAAAAVLARRLRYASALAFGVVHGLGFSNFLRLVLGDERSLLLPLLSFNLGLELAQVAVAGAMVLAGLAANRLLRVPTGAWNAAVSLIAGVLAAVMAVQRWPP